MDPSLAIYPEAIKKRKRKQINLTARNIEGKISKKKQIHQTMILNN
jgi:hypothetical protein